MNKLLIRQVTRFNSTKMPLELSCSKITREFIAQFMLSFLFRYFQLISHLVDMSNHYRFTNNKNRKDIDKYIN